MRTINMFLIILLFLSEASAIVDTLRNFSPLANNAASISASTYPTQVSCFYLDIPGTINGFLIELSGSAGEVLLHLYGNEGGSVGPVLGKNLIAPIKITKNNIGVEKIYVALAQPYDFDHDQFFVALDDFSAGVQLVTKNETSTPHCSSPNGGNILL